MFSLLNMRKINATQLVIKGLSSPLLSSMMMRIRSECVPIFMMHRFESKKHQTSGHKPQTLRKCLQFLKNQNYHVLSLSSLVKAIQSSQPIPSKSVVFTMDDGFADQAEVGVPIFGEFDYPVTIFLATGMVSQNTWSWDYKVEYAIRATKKGYIDCLINERKVHFNLHTRKQRDLATNFIINILKEASNNSALDWTNRLARELNVLIPVEIPSSHRMMTWDQVRALESPIVEFGAHTVNHHILSRLEYAIAKSEISDSQLRLSKEIKSPIDIFCYPSGRKDLDFTKREKKIVEELGFSAAVSADPGYVFANNQRNDTFALPRYSMPDDNYYEFIQYCTWIERFKQLLTNRI